MRRGCLWRMVVWSGGALVVFVLASGLYLWRGSAALDEEIDAIRAAGEPVTMADVRWDPIPEDENSAPVYQAAYDALSDPTQEESQILVRYLDAADTPAAGVEGYLRRNGIALDLARGAAKYPACRRELDWARGSDMHQGYLVTAMSLARALRIEGLFLARSGREAEAFEALRALFACAESLRDEPTIYSQMVRDHVQAIGCDLIRRLVAEGLWPASQARTWIDSLGGLQTLDPMRRAWIVERAMGIDYVLVRKFDSEGRVYDALSFLAGRDLAHYVRMMGEVIAAADLPRWQAREAIDELEDEACRLRIDEVACGMLLPAFWAVSWRQADALSRLELARAAIAVDAFRAQAGDWPGDLSALVGPWLDRPLLDQWTGDPLVYRVQMGTARITIERETAMPPDRERSEYEWVIPPPP